MSSLVRVALPLLMLMSLGGTAADAPAGCVAGDPLGSFLQDDAGLGTDASNVPEVADRLAAGDFSGALQLPVSGGPGDAADWYAMEVDEVARSVMVDLQDYLTDPPVALIVVDVYPPGAAEPTATVSTGEGRVSFAPETGSWSFHVRFITGPGVQCAEQSALPLGPADMAAMQHYLLYIGCDPVCV